jgi:hypothetical protein
MVRSSVAPGMKIEPIQSYTMAPVILCGLGPLPSTVWTFNPRISCWLSAASDSARRKVLRAAMRASAACT